MMKNKGLNKYFLIIFSITLMLLLGLSSLLKVKVKDVNINDIVNPIKNNYDFSNLQEGSAKDLKKIYGINPDSIEDFKIYTPISNMNADEFLILRVKNENDIEIFEKKIEEVTKKQANVFKDYAPDQYALIENKLMYPKGKYCILFIGKDSNKIREELKKFF